MPSRRLGRRAAAARPTTAKARRRRCSSRKAASWPAARARWSGWRGTLQQLDARPPAPTPRGWRAATWRWNSRIGNRAGATARAPGRAEVLGAVLRWKRASRAGGAGRRSGAHRGRGRARTAGRGAAAAAPATQFGWGGDLRLRGRLALHSAPNFTADIVIERERGDLTVTDETGTQSLGLTDLRLGLAAADGTWSFTQGLAGSTLGVAAGAFVARTSPQATWPAPDTPVSGVLELQVANLGTWGTWVPAGWRLGGALRVSAGIGGRFGAPEYTGRVDGRELSVRNFLQGASTCTAAKWRSRCGATAPRRTLHARAGEGTLSLAGDAVLGAAPQARVSARGAALPAARAHRPAHRHQRQRADAAGERTAAPGRPLRRRRRPDRLQQERRAGALRRRGGQARGGSKAAAPVRNSTTPRGCRASPWICAWIPGPEAAPARARPGDGPGRRAEAHFTGRQAGRRRHCARRRQHLCGLRPEARDRPRQSWSSTARPRTRAWTSRRRGPTSTCASACR